MVWGAKPAGAWADNVEEEEAAGALAAATPAAPTAFKAGQAKVREDDFPDLAMAVKVKETKKDKKKKAAKQTLSLTDFLKSDVGGGAPTAFRSSAFRSSGGGGGGGGGDVDLLSLPTAPRPRVEGEEPAGRALGGAFGGYGGREGGRGRYDDDRPPRDDEEMMGPSRADASDSWGADRKAAPAGGGDDRGRGGFGGGFRDRGGEREGGGGFRDGGREREGGFREGGFRDSSRDAGIPDGPSRADEADDWGKTKQFVPSSRGAGGGGGGGFEERRSGGFGGGGGFRDRSPVREGGFREAAAFREPSRADTEDKWSRGGGDVKPTAFEDRPRREFDDRPARRGGFGFGERDGSRDGPRDGSPPVPGRDGSQERVWRRADAPAAGGSEPPTTRARPKLNLAPRSAPAEGAAPAGGASKASVFGAARPREEVLKEQGRDAVKEDLKYEHEAVDRPETAEEKALRQEMSDLQIRVEAGEADAEYKVAAATKEAANEGEEEEGGAEEEEGGAGKTCTVAQALEELEGKLSKLQLDLDAKAKYARAAASGGERGGDRSRERAAQREASPGGWRRSGGDTNSAAGAPRGFRSDDRPPRSSSKDEERAPRRGGFEDRPRGGGGYEERPRGGGGGGGGGDEERGRRDNFPPRDARDGSRDKPRW